MTRSVRAGNGIRPPETRHRGGGQTAGGRPGLPDPRPAPSLASGCPPAPGAGSRLPPPCTPSSARPFRDLTAPSLSLDWPSVSPPRREGRGQRAAWVNEQAAAAGAAEGTRQSCPGPLGSRLELGVGPGPRPPCPRTGRSLSHHTHRAAATRQGGRPRTAAGTYPGKTASPLLPPLLWGAPAPRGPRGSWKGRRTGRASRGAQWQLSGAPPFICVTLPAWQRGRAVRPAFPLPPACSLTGSPSPAGWRSDRMHQSSRRRRERQPRSSRDGAEGKGAGKGGVPSMPKPGPPPFYPQQRRPVQAVPTAAGSAGCRGESRPERRGGCRPRCCRERNRSADTSPWGRRSRSRTHASSATAHVRPRAPGAGACGGPAGARDGQAEGHLVHRRQTQATSGRGRPPVCRQMGRRRQWGDFSSGRCRTEGRVLSQRRTSPLKVGFCPPERQAAVFTPAPQNVTFGNRLCRCD